MVRAVFLDIDGTLRDEQKGVPKSAAEAVRLCRKKGIRVLICTGRNLPSIQPDVAALKTDGIIAGGGCWIRDGAVVLKDAFFQYEEIQELLDTLLQTGWPVALENQEQIFMNRAAGLWYQTDFDHKLVGLGRKEKARRTRENRISYEENIKAYRAERDRIHKLCIWTPGDAYTGITAMAQKTGHIIQQGMWNGWYYMELLPPGCGKGAAIREWCRYRGILPKDTVGFGDGKNDIDMIRAVGTGVAMEDGDAKLKRCASRICPPAVQDGILKELIQLGVIKQEENG